MVSEKTMQLFDELQKEFTEKGFNKSVLEDFIKFNVKGEKLPYEKKPLASYTWDEIAQILEQGYGNVYFNIGDEKQEALYTGEQITCKMIGRNHDIISKTGKTCGATFLFFIDGEFEMNETYTNAGGWEKTKMKNVYMERIFKLLSPSLQRVIKVVNKPTSIGDEDTDIYVSEDKLFLLSEVEISGKTEYSAEGEGEQYEFFKDGGKLPEKWFWLRSPYVPSSYFFCYWTTNGYVNYTYANSNYRLALCFCI